MKTTVYKYLVVVSIFAIAMGFLESAVVIYLRALYYPLGFTFPLCSMPTLITKVEIVREIATILMLVAIGYLAGKTKLERFAWFVYAFALWDLVYYLGLYICLAWPASLHTWDILFLIPIPWVGPVWSVYAIALLMLAGGLHVIYECSQNSYFKISKRKWLALWSGISICLIAFMLDYLRYSSTAHWLNILVGDGFVLSNLNGYIPNQFNVPLFLSGLLTMAAPIVYSIYQSFKNN